MAKFVETTKGKPTSKGKGIFEVKLITEGWGSSGYYSKEMLEEYGPKVFTKNTLSYANHSSQEELEKGRDITKIVGKYVEDATGREDEDGKYALYAPLKVREEWIDFVEEYKDSIGASIFVTGEASEGEAAGRSGLIVESLDADDPYKSVDLVAAAGRGGKVERMLEAYRATEAMTNNTKSQVLSKAANEAYEKYVWVEDFTDDILYINTDEKILAVPYSLDGNVVTLESSGAIEVRREIQYTPITASEKEENMADKDIEALSTVVEGLRADLAALVEALKPVEPKTEDVDRAEVVEAAIKEGLSVTARGRVLKAVENGETPEDAIKAEKALRDEILAEAGTSDDNSGSGRIVEGANTRDLSTLFKR
jgi:predicted transcriptional regulator